MAYSNTRRPFYRPTAFISSPPDPADWRCLECGKLLGVRHGALLHIRLQRHNYLVNLPVEAVCYGCGADNKT